MRIWDLPPRRLCNRHLVAEHGESHALWSILVNKKRGFSRHPETLRWRGRLKALYLRHDAVVQEMKRRGFRHKSPLDESLATGRGNQNIYLQSLKKQEIILKEKTCSCQV